MTVHKKTRTMDRHRYVPSAEGLEGRELMASVNTLFGVAVSPTSTYRSPSSKKSCEFSTCRITWNKSIPDGLFPRPRSSKFSRPCST